MLPVRVTERVILQFRRQFRLGQLAEKIEAGATFFPSSYMDIQMSWKKQNTSPSASDGKGSEENLLGRLLFNKARYPAFNISAQKQDWETRSWSTSKKTIKSDFEYQVPPVLLKKLSIPHLWNCVGLTNSLDHLLFLVPNLC